jgi:hypothetical protein
VRQIRRSVRRQQAVASQEGTTERAVPRSERIAHVSRHQGPTNPTAGGDGVPADVAAGQEDEGVPSVILECGVELIAVHSCE